MKNLFIISAGLTAISAVISAYLFVNSIGEGVFPHWILLIVAIISLAVLISAEYGPKPIHKERGFGAILIGVPLVSLLFQSQYFSTVVPVLSFLESDLIPLLAMHIFLMIAGNYITTSKSLLTGLPTFWNMRSDLSWRKSHRLLGYGLVVVAAFSALWMLITGQFSRYVLGGGFIGLIILVNFYSAWVWHADPDKQPLHGRGDSDVI